MAADDVIAPFVMKIYQMVSEQTTDCLITWGKANNSFIVIDPLDFSQRILPAYFKHNNFSSFVRQLNTYGFRKVDPDRWEFANEWFLRGQRHLLKHIVRRKHSSRINTFNSLHNRHEKEEDEKLSEEIAKLKQEQSSLEQELQGMNKRLEASEKRPHQMMAFLCKVVQDPEILPRMVLEKERTKGLTADKRRRLMVSSPPSLPSSGGVAASLPEERVISPLPSPSSETPPGFWLSQRQVTGRPLGYSHFTGDLPAASADVLDGFTMVAPPMSGVSGYDRSGVDLDYFGAAEASPPPYPFSLLGGGF